MKATDLIEQIKEIAECVDQLPMPTASDFVAVAKRNDAAIDEILQAIYDYEDENDESDSDAE